MTKFFANLKECGSLTSVTKTLLNILIAEFAVTELNRSICKQL